MKKVISFVLMVLTMLALSCSADIGEQTSTPAQEIIGKSKEHFSLFYTTYNQLFTTDNYGDKLTVIGTKSSVSLSDYTDDSVRIHVFWINSSGTIMYRRYLADGITIDQNTMTVPNQGTTGADGITAILTSGTNGSISLYRTRSYDKYLDIQTISGSYSTWSFGTFSQLASNITEQIYGAVGVTTNPAGPTVHLLWREYGTMRLRHQVKQGSTWCPYRTYLNNAPTPSYISKPMAIGGGGQYNIDTYPQFFYHTANGRIMYWSPGFNQGNAACGGMTTAVFREVPDLPGIVTGFSFMSYRYYSSTRHNCIFMSTEDTVYQKCYTGFLANPTWDLTSPIYMISSGVSGGLSTACTPGRGYNGCSLAYSDGHTLQFLFMLDGYDMYSAVESDP